jgi:DNA-3-methyladenine glycosylase
MRCQLFPFINTESMTTFITMTDFLQTRPPSTFNMEDFDQDAQDLAKTLLGKILAVRQQQLWLMARIIETEAYYLSDKASHASLGVTKSRAALFAPPGTIYMYYSRGGDSLNFSARGAGNAVLIKSAYPVVEKPDDKAALAMMQTNNPNRDGSMRSPQKLTSGQTLACRALGLKVADWDNRMLDPGRFIIMDDGYRPPGIIQTTRLGINPLRDAQLPYRFIDIKFKSFCTKDPTRVRDWQLGKHYTILVP